MHTPGSDEELAARLRAGDESAFDEIVDRYHPQLIRLARTFVSNAEAAEDVAQETWIALITGIGRFEGRSSLRSWLFQVCANRARSLGTREHQIVPVEHIEPAVDAEHFHQSGAWTSPPTPWPDETETRLDDTELAAIIREAILTLPAMHQSVVTLRDVDGLSAQEVCEILSITDANQRVILHRGRERIRMSISRTVVA